MQDYIPRPIDVNETITSFSVKQYDNNSRKIYFDLRDKDNPNEKIINLENHTVRAYFKLPDSSIAFVDGEVIDSDEGKIAVTIPSSVTQQIGTVKCEICISGVEDNTFLSLRVFSFDVIESIRDDAAIEATEEFSALENALNTVDSLNARIDNLVSLPEGSTTGDAELADIRVGADGTTYDSAGTAVRAQVSQINNDFAKVVNIEKIVSLNLNDEQYEYGIITDTGGLMDATDACRSVNFIPVEGGKSIKFYSVDCNYLRICEYDESQQFLSGKTLYRMQQSGDGIVTELLLNADTTYIKFDSYSLHLTDKISIYYSENAAQEYVPYEPMSVDATLKYEKIYDENGNSIDEIISEKIPQNSGGVANNEEVEDIRIGYDGTTYESAGEAVREQVRLLDNALDEIDSAVFTEGEEIVTLTSDDYVTNSGCAVRKTDSDKILWDTSNPEHTTLIRNVSEGEIYYLSGKAMCGDNYCVLVLLSDSDTIPSQHGGTTSLITSDVGNYDYWGGMTDTTRWTAVANYKITIPTGAKYMYVMWYQGTVPTIKQSIRGKASKIPTKTGDLINDNTYMANSVFTLPEPTVTVGSLEYQQKISKDDRPCWLWNFNTVGAMEINGISVPRTTDDIVGIWVYINQEALTWKTETDGVFSVYVDGSKTQVISSAYMLHNGWNYIKLDMSYTGTKFNLKFDFTMVRGNYQVAIDTVELNYKTRTQVLLSFDMFGTDGYNVRYPLLDSYGFKATFCNPDQGLTADMRNELFAKGWDWAIYNGRDSAGITRPDVYTGTADEWYDYLKPAVDSCANIGLFDPLTYFSPSNVGTPAIMEALQRLGFKIGRVAAWGNYYTEYFDKNSFYIYTYGVGGTATAEDTLAMLDTAIEEGRSVCIFTHQVQDTLTDDMHCTKDVYTAILDGIKERVDAGLCDVVTFSEFYRHWCPEDCAEHLETRHQKEHQGVATTLFDSATGDNTSATIELSDDLTNYSHIEVIYGVDGAVSSARALNSQTVAMSITQSDADSFKITTGTAILNGTQLTRDADGFERQLIINHATEGQLDFTGSTPGSGYYISIYRVIGYK